MGGGRACGRREILWEAGELVGDGRACPRSLLVGGDGCC